jgi:hypothetical protein
MDTSKATQSRDTSAGTPELWNFDSLCVSNYDVTNRAQAINEDANLF